MRRGWRPPSWRCTWFPGLLPGGAARPGAPSGAAPAAPVASVSSYSAAVTAIAPAVVNVYATQIQQRTVHPLFRDPLFRRFFGNPPVNEQRNSNLGSGVLVDPQGYLLTNAHVIRQADEIRVTLRDGRQSMAEVVGIDADTDLAVLKIALESLPVAPLSDAGRPQVGDVVLAIGNPYDFGQTVTQGIVSATQRNRLGIATFEDFIQTDADINPGNSGGALVSATGQLIGINTAIISSSGGSQGIGLAIPIGLAMNVMRQLIDHGYVTRGWLGVELQIVPSDIAAAAELEEGGALVAAMLNRGPAAQAGLRPGDILISVNGSPLRDPQQAINMIAQIQPGATVGDRAPAGLAKVLSSRRRWPSVRHWRWLNKARGARYAAPAGVSPLRQQGLARCASRG